MTDIDNLQIKLKANSNSASRSIDTLIGKIDKLSTSLGTLKSDSLNYLSVRISNLGKSMATLDSTKTADLNKIVNAINRVSKIDATGLTNVSNELTPLATSLTALGNVSNLSNITPAINAIKNLARTDLSTFDTSKLGSIANVISNFATQLGSASKIDASITKIISAMVRLANSGQYINNVATYFPQLANQVTGLVTALAGAGTIDVNIAKIVDGIARLASAGNNVGITVANLQNLTNGLVQMIKQLNSLPTINANLASLVQGIGNIATSGSRAGSVVNSLSNYMNRFSSSTKSARTHSLSLTSAIGTLYAKFWILLRVFRLLKKGMDLSSDLTEVQNVVDTTFGDMAYKVEDLAKNSIEQFGMSELALKQYSSRFQAMGTNMGANSSAIQKANEFLNEQTNGYVELSDSMSDVSLTLTKLTADMASFYNVDQKDVAEDLESVFTGQTRPLRTYGLDLTEATLKEWALKNGLDANISAMSQAEKTMLRYQYVLANTGAAQGDFSRTADTWANQTRILIENFKQLGVTIGGTFINLLKPAVKALNVVIAKLQEFALVVSNSLGKIFGWQYEEGGGITQDFEDAEEITGGVSDNLGSAAANAKELKSHMLAIDELNVVEKDNGSGSGGGSGSGSGSGSGGTSGGKWIQTESMFQNYESELDTLYKLGDFIGTKLTNAMNNINWQSVYEGARNFGKGLADFLNGLISPDLFGAVGRTIAGALNTAIYASLSFASTIEWEELGLSIAEGINNLFIKFDFKALGKSINTWVQGILKTIKTAILNIKWGEVVNGSFDFLGELDFSTILVLLIPKLRKISTLVGSISKNFSIKKLKKITTNLTKMQKATVTAVAGLAEFKVVSSSFEKLRVGTDGLLESFGKIAGTMGVAGAAISQVLGVPAGILATGLIGLVAMFKGLSDAEHTLIEQSEIEQYGDTVSNVVARLKESSNAVKERAEAAVEYVQTAGLSEMQMASDLADKYFNLAEKENLSNEEKTEMKNLASLLVGKFPELEECYNTENGLLETSRKRVKELIDEKLKNIQLNALEEQLTQAYKDQYNQLQDVKEGTELVNGEKEKLNKLEEEYNDLSSKQDMLNEYYDLSDKIIGVQGDTTELQKRQQELWDELTNGGQDALPTYEQLSVEMEAVSEEMSLIKPIYEEALSGLSESTGAYEAASKSISELSNMLSTGMYGAAENGVAGFGKGMSDNTDVIKEANTLLMEAGMKSATDALDEHSPSKKYEKFGKYSVDGYNLGFTKNEKTTIQTIKRFMDNVLSKFREMIEPVKQVGSDIMSGFCDAITEWEDKLYKRIDKISNNFTKKIKNMYGSISNTGTVSGNVTLTLSMPKFATGGVVTRPTLGMFGEDGAEAIVPLEKNTGWINSVAEQMQGFSSNASDELLREQNNLLRQQNALLSELANKEVVATLDTSRKTIKGLRDAEKRLGFSFT